MLAVEAVSPDALPNAAMAANVLPQLPNQLPTQQQNVASLSMNNQQPTIPQQLTGLRRADTPDAPNYQNRPPVKVKTVSTQANLVQLAFLLDTSNSMDGLIEQAKSRLWGILNQIIRARRQGQAPDIQIALYEYGNSRLSAEEYFIRQVVAFTTDVDEFSDQLFGLQTSGGEEYCGAVLARSLEELAWSVNPAALRLLYIAGNEPFTQGPKDPKAAILAANEADILVNTIFCGDPAEGRSTGWNGGNGSYLYIYQDLKTVYIETPFDSIINRLNEQLNQTYVPIGGNVGEAAKEKQSRQDQNAASYGAANAASRAQYKASANYRASWDLLDTYDEKGAAILEKTADLPTDWHPLSLAARHQKMAELREKRRAVSEAIQNYSQLQAAYIKDKKTAIAGEEVAATLGDRISQSVQEQLLKKGFELLE